MTTDLLHVVAAAVIREGRLLVVSKHAAPGVFYLPGGKPDPGESEATTLDREVREELGARPRDVVPYVVVEAEAALEKVPMRLSVYRCDLSAEPAPAAEIAAMGWTSGRDDYVARLAPAIRGTVVPRLLSDGLLPAAG